jgi:hypothetical protein
MRQYTEHSCKENEISGPWLTWNADVQGLAEIPDILATHLWIKKFAVGNMSLSSLLARIKANFKYNFVIELKIFLKLGFTEK